MTAAESSVVTPPLSRLAVIGVAAAAALVPLNSTMIAVALPSLAEDFGISVGRASIFITVYLVAMLLGQPLSGRISDRIGDRRAVNVALIGFGAFSLACGASGSFGTLLVARGGQAAFASALSPSVQSLLRTGTSPSERGRMFGILGSVLGVGAAAGPVIGGALTELFGWQAIFLVNLPVVAVALLVSLRLGSVDRPDDRASIGVKQAGPTAPIVNRVFLASFSAQAFSTQAQYTLLLLTPVILTARGWGSGSIGVVLSSLTVGMIVFGPLGGRAGDRHGRRLPVLVGLALASGSMVLLLIAGASVRPVLLVLALLAFGVGLGGAVPNFMTAALDSVPETRAGTAAGVFSMSRYVGSISTSVALAAFVATDASGSRVLFAIAVLSMSLAMLVAGWLPTQPAHATPHVPVTGR
jgi:MFS family permease